MRWAGVRRWFGDGLLGAHRATFLTGVLSFMVLGAMGYPQWGACTAGLFLCCSGVLAIWGGRSGVYWFQLGVHWLRIFPGKDSSGQPSLATRVHAWLTGILVVALGLFFLWGGVSGLLATYRSDQRILTRGEVSKSVLGGRGLAVTDEFAVWGGILSSSYAPPTLSLMKLLIPGGEIQQAVVVDNKFLVIMYHSVRGYYPEQGQLRSESIFDVPADALAVDGEHVAILGSGGLYLGNSRTKRVRLLEKHRTWKGLNVMAVREERVWYGPTNECGLVEHDRAGCALELSDRPCALAHAAGRLAALTDRGELLLLDATQPQSEVRRVATPIPGCGLALDATSAYVAGPNLAQRVDLASGKVELLRETGDPNPVSDGTLGAGRFYWRTEKTIYGVYADAPGLE